MNFDEVDNLAIINAHNEVQIWSSEELKPVKEKLKTHLLSKCEFCCYCRRPFKGEFKMVIDIEHILPSSIFRELAFELKNLSLSCKRCNMQIKKDRMDFLNGNLEKVALYLKNKNNLSRYISQCSRLGHINKLNRIIFCSLNYKFIHPVLDDYSQHLRLLSFQFDDKSTVIYIPKTQKGIYAKYFFRLSEFESRDLNISTQFLHDPDNISDYNVPSLV